MSDMVELTLPLPREDYEQIEELADEHGLETIVFAALVLHLLAESKTEAGNEKIRAFVDAMKSEVGALDQAYFWTEEWQAGEREADEDIAAGRVEKFDTMEDLIADLLDDE